MGCFITSNQNIVVTHYEKNTTLTEVMTLTKEEQFVLDLRAKKIEQLNDRVSQRDLSIEKLRAEILNLRDENSELAEERVKTDRIVQNQKYQLGKYAEEVLKLQEEIEALKYFAKRYLEV